METIVVYSADTSSRLEYVLNWLLKERLQLDYRITADEQETAGLPFFIAYGKPLQNAVSIPGNGLLWQKGRQQGDVAVGTWNELPTLFAYDAGNYSLPFDLFSALFFLLSRYEEYYPYKPDKHERYPATDSILCKNGWLQRPIADEWVYAFRKVMQQALSPDMEPAHFAFQPTYDIDIAYSHLHKGIVRLAGAYVRALLKVDIRQINERTKVLKKKQKDPFDSFRWLRQLHREYDLKPRYFVLCALRTTAYDKNIHPHRPAMIRVIKNLVRDGTVGAHPSYYATSDLMAKEKHALEQVSGRPVFMSRQHYMRMKMPDTCRMLLQNGITEDYSMGYGSHLGFRAGTGNPFYWYDLDKDEVTPLRIYPFCFMDTTAHYEMKLSASEAFEKLEAMSRILEKTGSTLTTVFHNFSLGAAAEWKGWRQAYEQFVQEKAALRPGLQAY